MCVLNYCSFLVDVKGIDHPIIKVLLSFTLPHFVSNTYDLGLSAKGFFKNASGNFFIHAPFVPQKKETCGFGTTWRWLNNVIFEWSFSLKTKTTLDDIPLL